MIPFGIIGAILGHLPLGKDLSVLSLIGIVGLLPVLYFIARDLERLAKKSGRVRLKTPVRVWN